MDDVLLSVEGLKTYFPIKGFFGQAKNYVKAVNGVSFRLYRGETYGLVGETGCGKSTLGRTIIRLEKSTGGKVFFRGENILKFNSRQLLSLRPQIQMVFQDPYSSLNPRKRVGSILTEVLDIHNVGEKKERPEIVLKVLSKVGLRVEHFYRYPNEFSGGQRQRIGLARALLLKPRIVICDEPVSALDVSIRAQIINLMRDLQETERLTYLFIAHDLGIVRYISNRIGVMYLGNLVEESPADDLFDHPLHPYTKALLAAIPTIDITKKPETIMLKGEISSPINPTPGCRFAPRCVYAGTDCGETQNFEELTPGHYVACCRAKDINGL
jgi:peptide/nickel transport system ATP-binding protein/oligopeptide transport system ATP-binding protein